MKEIKKIIKGKKFHYDEKYDLLYLKITDVDYEISEEIDNIVVDFDKKHRIIGLEIIDAADFFNISKQTLSGVKKWLVKVLLKAGKIYLNIEFKIKQGNKTFIKNPIIVESLRDKVPDAEMVCAVG